MPLLQIENLNVSFPQHEGVVQAVRGISLSVEQGESVGIVGESGSGKSVTCMAALRLLREPPAQITADRLDLGGVDMLRANRRGLARLRGRHRVARLGVRGRARFPDRGQHQRHS